MAIIVVVSVNVKVGTLV